MDVRQHAGFKLLESCSIGFFFFFFFPKVRAGKGLIIGAQTKTFSICLYSSLSVYVWKRV